MQDEVNEVNDESATQLELKKVRLHKTAITEESKDKRNTQ